ncbi:MAG: hypothetical protein GY781_07345 [Gammaproteobacteria bacterium]|nr:hypothetical protein [Gammaproteobacteria bacterium]
MVSLYINNATDERVQYFHSTGLFEYNFSSSGSSDPLASSYDHYHRETQTGHESMVFVLNTIGVTDSINPIS